jgi:hypothetical protein
MNILLTGPGSPTKSEVVWGGSEIRYQTDIPVANWREYSLLIVILSSIPLSSNSMFDRRNGKN